jgi:hypothetical protein
MWKWSSHLWVILVIFLVSAPWWPSEESDRTEIYSVKPPEQEVHVCTKFQFQSSHQRMNCTHNPSITKYLPVPMPGFESNLNEGNLNLNCEWSCVKWQKLRIIWCGYMRRSQCKRFHDSSLWDNSKKSKLGHFSTTPINQEKSHMAPIFGSVSSLDQGVLLHKATGR